MIARNKILACLLIGFLVAFMPISLDFNEHNQKAYIKGVVAFADETDNPQGFIDAAAAQSGMSSSDFVATVAGIIAVGSGINVVNTVAVNFGLDLEDNLSHFVDAADYPAWDTLDDDTKAAYDNNSVNYDAAKFNSFMEAFGLGDARDRYYGFDSSGGGNWDASWTENELDSLDRIGSIGTNWALGLSNSAGEVASAITDRSAITSYFPSQYYEYTKTDDDVSWPSAFGETARYVLTNGFTVILGDGTTKKYAKSSIPVYTMYFVGSNQKFIVWFYDTDFGAWIYSKTTNIPPTSGATQFSLNGKTYYYTAFSDNFTNVPIPSSALNNSFSFSGLKNLIYILMNGQSNSIGGTQDVIDYPVDLPDDTGTYYPEQGITKETPWADFILVREPVVPATGDLAEVIALLRRFNFYATGELKVHDEKILSAIQDCCERFTFYTTGQLKVHDEGVFDNLTDIGTVLNEIKSILQLWPKGDATDAPDIIGQVDFDEFDNKAVDLVDTISSLAPFGSVLLLSEIYAIVSAGGVIDEPSLEFDFDFFYGHHNVVVVDLSWMTDLRPVINFFMILLLLVLLTQISIRVVEMEAAG